MPHEDAALLNITPILIGDSCKYVCYDLKEMLLAAAFLSFLTSLLLGAMLLSGICEISYRKHLFDFMDSRKVHKNSIPRLGGGAFLPALIMSVSSAGGIMLLLSPHSTPTVASCVEYLFSLTAFTTLWIVGITDDLVGVGYKAKFGAQFIAAALITLSGTCLDNLHGVFGLYALPLPVSILLSVLLLVFIANAVNLIDGIDGLASGLGLLALFTSGIALLMSGDIVGTLLAAGMAGVLAAFFAYNVFGQAERRRKIFMGDGGSLTLGLAVGTLAFRLCSAEPAATGIPVNPVLVAFSLLMIPCLDVLRVMSGRLFRRQNPFMPDKTHLHHRLMALGLSQRQVLTVLLASALFFLLLGLVLAPVVNATFILLLDIALWAVGNRFIARRLRTEHQPCQNA